MIDIVKCETSILCRRPSQNGREKRKRESYRAAYREREEWIYTYPSSSSHPPHDSPWDENWEVESPPSSTKGNRNTEEWWRFLHNAVVHREVELMGFLCGLDVRLARSVALWLGRGSMLQVLQGKCVRRWWKVWCQAGHHPRRFDFLAALWQDRQPNGGTANGLKPEAFISALKGIRH